MKARYICRLPLLVALSLVAGAHPAQATLTPAPAGFRATATTASLVDESNSHVSYCPSGNLNGITGVSGGSITATLTFTGVPGQTCEEDTFLTSVTWTCRGSTTWRSTSSVVNVVASGTITLETGFSCVVMSAAGTRTFRGSQTPSNCTWTFDQARENLTVRCFTVRIDGGGESALFITYAIEPSLTMDVS
jgi:hypothetical protein